MSYLNVVMEMLITYPKKERWGQMALFIISHTGQACSSVAAAISEPFLSIMRPSYNSSRRFSISRRMASSRAPYFLPHAKTRRREVLMVVQQ